MSGNKVPLAAVVLLAASLAFAGEEADFNVEVDALARPLVGSGKVVGLALGTIDGGRTHVFGYGTVSRNTRQTPGGNTVFEIGSITKVFTALLLVDLVERRRLRLEDPVQKFLPGTVTVPKRGDRVITLLDLTTHTSGLPRLSPGLVVQAARKPENPYADYTVEDLYAFLSKHALARVPGTQYSYSNLGAGLLGHVLARREKTAYEDLVKAQICRPLGMKDTCIELSDDLRRRLAQGHDRDGKPVPNWDIPTLPGAGALRSTVGDLLIFLSANLGLRKTRLAAAIRATHVPRRPIGKGRGRIALGWHVRPDDAILWHNGGTGGYHSFIAFREQGKIGVVVLGNSSVDAVDELGLKLMRVLSARQAQRHP
jgi:D-alanyl-D-alanine-carboxypeptidase/D-alanyl-D-alanine-endopeptidase